jgi:hypothetical protein
MFALLRSEPEIYVIPLSLANQTTIFKYVKDAVSDLQCAVKCAMGQFNDARPSGMLRVLTSLNY